jgi:hypothetical protein
MARKIGAGYINLIRSNPESIIKGLTPATTPQEVMQRYALSRPTSGDSMNFHLDGTPEWQGITVDADTGKAVKQFHGKTQGFRPLVQMIDPQKQYGLIDATMLSQGSGAGRQLYPAVFDTLANQEMGNYTTTLTPINGIKRNYNSIASTIRHPDGMPSVFVNPDQIPFWDGNPADFAMLSPEEKVGQYLMNGALGMKVRQAGAIRNLQQQVERGSPISAQRLQTTQDLGFNPGQGEWGGLSAQSSPQDYTNLVSGLRGVDLEDLGANTAKKVMITDALSQDAPVNPDLLKGLEYRTGGKVQMPGPLRRMYCNAP